MKFNSEINVSTVIALVGLLGTGAAGFASGQQQITRNEERINQQARELNTLRIEIREDLKEVRADQKRILEAVRK